MPRKTTKKTTIKKVEPEITERKSVNLKHPEGVNRLLGLRNLRIILVAFLFFGIILYFFMTYFIIAWVDKFPITRFEYWSALEKSPEATQIREQLVIEKLLLNEERRRNIKVTDEEAEEEFKKVEGQIGKENIESQLSQFNLTRDDFKKQLKIRLAIKNMFGKDVKVTNEELTKYIKDNEQNLNPGSNKAISDADKEKIREQLLNQKIQQNFLSWLEETQKSSRVLRIF